MQTRVRGSATGDLGAEFNANCGLGRDCDTETAASLLDCGKPWAGSDNRGRYLEPKQQSRCRSVFC